MASISGACSTLALLAGGLLSAGCTESFVGTIGGNGGDTTASTGGTTGSGASTSSGGTGGTTTSGDCTDGAMRACYSGKAGTDGVGVCKHGQQTCAQGAWGTCKGQVLPAAMEICDGVKDDDCDGAVDNGCACSVGATQSCYDGTAATEGVGLCHAGTQTCKANATWGMCNGEVTPAVEVCDGADNDCNGTTDDIEGVGMSCTAPGQGACAMGKSQCQGETLSCVGPDPKAEVCNGIDDDCNGKTDDGIPSGGACQTPGCTGSIECTGGGMHCVLWPTGKPEVCGDQIDNDCDGVVDPPTQLYWGDTFSNGADKWIVGEEWSIGGAVSSPPAPPYTGDPGTDHSPGGDDKLAGVVIGGNATTTPHAGHYLTSKPIDLSQVDGSVVLVYHRWLNSAPQPGMVSTVDVWNGGSWVTIWQNADGAGVSLPITDAVWTRQAFDVSQYKGQQFQIRFGVTVNPDPNGPPPIPVGSWNIDDVALTSCY